MICKNDCRECEYFNGLRLVCKKDIEIMIVPFDIKRYLENYNGIYSVEEYKYEYDNLNFNYRNEENLYVIRRNDNFFISFKNINDYLKKMGMEIIVYEFNNDKDGNYLLVKVI